VARARSAAALFAVLALCGSAGAHASGKAPTGLRAFLLRSDEPVVHTFSRTPSFGWNPVQGARRYQFELATGPRFSDNAVVWSATNIKAPTVAVPLSLPWITGDPYSLYAHVRAVTSHGPGPWSTPFGFNMRWPTVPTPVGPTYPGLLHWTAVPGASAYSVWIANPADPSHSKVFDTQTNMADEREFYTFHQDPSWTGVVQWRVRALRVVYGTTNNGLPSVSYGPWSRVYTSVNPAPTSGPLTAQASVTSIVSDSAHTRIHEAMPGFVYSGDTDLYGFKHELYRVEIFTDQDCLNPVFHGAVVGSPAYVPRATGPLAMPADVTSEINAWDDFLPNGKEPDGLTLDGDTFTTNELDVPQGQTFAKVDLWDNSWPGGRYYWTVVPVDAEPQDALDMTLAVDAAPGDTTIAVDDATGVGTGDALLIGPSPGEHAVVSSVTGNAITLTAGLKAAHSAGVDVERPSGGLTYRDEELAQDACAAGRVLGFGKASPPAVTRQSAPFASGLSPNGKLVAATKKTPKFYGTPLVAWLPIASAQAYEIQVSRKRYPWRTAGSQVTWSTALTLPVPPGTWYYRVRGLDLFMTGSKPQLSWSAPVRLVVTKPRFRVVR
jgi:hypothetical protein